MLYFNYGKEPVLFRGRSRKETVLFSVLIKAFQASARSRRDLFSLMEVELELLHKLLRSFLNEVLIAEFDTGSVLPLDWLVSFFEKAGFFFFSHLRRKCNDHLK